MDEVVQDSQPKQEEVKPEEPKSEPIFKIQKTRKSKNGQQKLTVQEQTGIRKYSALKHGLYADLPFVCNTCVFRPKEEGGSVGGCQAFQKDSICTIRADARKVYQKFNVRKIEDLYNMVQELIVAQMEEVTFAKFSQKLAGNVADKEVRAEMNQLMMLIKLAKELGSTQVIAKQTEQYNDKGQLITVMKEVLQKRASDLANKESESSVS